MFSLTLNLSVFLIRFRYRSTFIPGEYRPSRAHGNRSSRKPASEERRKYVIIKLMMIILYDV